MGLDHDRGFYNNCGDGIGYNYGYRDTQNNFRSIMAYPCSSYPGCDTPVGGSCSLVGRFSNINSPYNGKPIGSSEANNAKVLADNRLTVANYRPRVNTGVGTCSESNKLPFKLILTLDAYPRETTWTVTDDVGTTVLSGGPYFDSDKETEIVIEDCLQDSSYTFTINDIWGDGICCSWGSGDYKLYWNDVLSGSGGDFGETESITFGSCTDLDGWEGAWGLKCSFWERWDDPGCPQYGNSFIPSSGTTANEACCHCKQ